MPPLAWLALPAAYLVGGVSPGYWLVRLRTGADLRTQGSGVTGATNAARLLGRGGFALVLALDAAKGALVCALARITGLTGGWEFAAAAAVVAGHVWPVQLGFRGGRGLGPLLGAWLVLAPAAIGACLVLATWAETRALPAAGLAAVTAAIVLIAHRSHWRSSPPSPSQE
jgi:glycerol-3-phosphate acyltransferase PlsY